jgi:uncharacterized membrane protein
MESQVTNDREVEQKAPAQVEQNLEALVALHAAAEEAVTRQQRAVERLVSRLAVPSFLLGVLIVVAIWVGVNLFLQAVGRGAWDNPPFAWLQTLVSLLSFVVTMVVVITQNRLGKVADLNAHLDLQVNLLVDQKVSKVIQLLEEMRTDLPMLANRRDHKAEEFQEAVDPANLATLITDKLSSISDISEEATKE